MNRHLPFLAACILPLVGLYKLSGEIHWKWILGYITTISLVTFVLYWQDKRQAQAGGWRVTNKTLYLCKLLGGWAAAYSAQQVFHHKTNKRSYRVAFWCIVGFYQFLALEWITDWRISRWVGSLL